MPWISANGSHQVNEEKYRFLVMSRYDMDIHNLFLKNDKHLPLNTVYQLGIQILHVLEYIHHQGYIHADIKGSNLLLGRNKDDKHQVYLVDYGLACKHTNSEGVHKEYKADKRFAHDGTIEFTSRDAHIGAHSRRSDLEILGYNMLQWLCGKLPWEEDLGNVEYVKAKKEGFMSDLDKLMNICFNTKNNIPVHLYNYFKYIVGLKFEEQPDYSYLRGLFEQHLKSQKVKADGPLIFTSDRQPEKKRPSKRKAAVASGNSSSTKNSDEENVDRSVGTSPVKKSRATGQSTPRKPLHSNRNMRNSPVRNSPVRNTRSSPSPSLIMDDKPKRKGRKAPPKLKMPTHEEPPTSPSPSLPDGVMTDAMRMVLEKINQNQKTPRTPNGKKAQKNQFPPPSPDTPEQDILTPAMEHVMKIKEKRLSIECGEHMFRSPDKPVRSSKATAQYLISSPEAKNSPTYSPLPNPDNNNEGKRRICSSTQTSPGLFYNGNSPELF
jgi:vaccinia related kinase